MWLRNHRVKYKLGVQMRKLMELQTEAAHQSMIQELAGGR